jgi:D-arabinose 1-dehydrogenase-like Zn-dependent alcohol dehydrogenase
MHTTGSLIFISLFNLFIIIILKNMGSTFGFLLKPLRLGYSRPLPLLPFIYHRNINNNISKSIPYAINEDNLMSAIYYEKHGSSSVLKFAENSFSKPIPIKGQLLVRIYSFSINPNDIQLRSANMSNFILPLPKIPSTDFCGEIIDNSQSELNKFKIGDKVICMMPTLYSHWGASAEYCATDENLLVKAPKNISPKEASVFPLVGLTVIQAFSKFVKR